MPKDAGMNPPHMGRPLFSLTVASTSTQNPAQRKIFYISTTN